MYIRIYIYYIYIHVAYDLISLCDYACHTGSHRIIEEATNGHSLEHVMILPGEMETWRRCYSGLCCQRLSRIVPERRLGVTNDSGQGTCLNIYICIYIH